MNTLFKGSEIIQYLAVSFGAVNILTSGLQYGWPSSFLPELLSYSNPNVNVHLTAAQGSWVAVGPLLGAIIGSPLAGYTLDKVGRRRIILFTFFPYTISFLVIATATSPLVLIIGRFISGISDGCIFTSLPVYIGEIASPKVRGCLGSFIPICLISGVVLINLLGAFLTVSTATLLCIIFPLISFIGMWFMPESPYQLIMMNKESEAEVALERLRGTDDIEEEKARIKESIETQRAESKGKLRDIFMVSSNRRALLIMMLLRAVQQFSGITALIFYISTILKEAGATHSVTICTVAFFVLQLVMSIIGSMLVDWTGRRPLLLWSSIGSIIALLIEGFYFQLQQERLYVSNWDFVPVMGLLVFVIFYGVGLQNVPLIMIGELFPTNIKAAAVCFADLYFALLATVVSKVFQIMNSDTGPSSAFYLFAGGCSFFTVLVYYFVPETKNITLEEIQLLIKDGRRYHDTEKRIDLDNEE